MGKFDTENEGRPTEGWAGNKKGKNHKMKYAGAEVRPLRELEQDLVSGDLMRIAFALVDLLASVDNYEYLRGRILSYVVHESTEIASLAIHCLGDLARLYPGIAVNDVEDWKALLLNLRDQRNELRGAVDDALGDFDIFLRRK